ncbi:MAG TPA: MFS transporter [Jatrophihabitans sp.]|nr:MFS transporter [Jatrophihabitans sp.]
MVADAKSEWRPVVAYAALSAVNQMLWLTYAPITTDAARHYRVSDATIGWLAEIFPLIYVVLAIPAGRLIDRRMPWWLGCGAVLTAAGGLLRLAGDSYLPVFLGQVLVAVAQPLVLNAVTAVSVRYLHPRDRAAGIAVSSAGIFLGMVLALVLGAGFGAGRLRPLLEVQAALGVVAAVGLCASLRRPARGADVSASPAPLREVWADRYLRRLVGLVCLGFGVFIALTTWLETLLKPAGVTSGTSGYLLVGMVVSGVVCSAVLAPVLARRAIELRWVRASVLGSSAAMVLLAVAPGTGSGAVALIVVGGLLLTDLPVVLELVERRAGSAAGTATALVWLAGNAAGLAVALVVQLLVHVPQAAFSVLAGLLLLGLPLLRSLRPAATVRS